MRTACEAQVDVLTIHLADLCQTTGSSMERATRALLRSHLALAEQVIGEHGDLLSAIAAAEESGVRLLGRARPGSREARSIVSAIQNLTDIERMGALALHVAQIARMPIPQCAIPEELNGYLAEMSRLAVELAESASYVLCTGDPGRVVSIRADDEAMDDLHRHLFTLMSERRWKHGIAATIDLTLLGRYYDRFADHSVAVSRRVIFDLAGQSSAEDRAWNPPNPGSRQVS